MELPLFTGFESMLEMAEQRDRDGRDRSVSARARRRAAHAVVTVRNLTGHYLPTGVGFRRDVPRVPACSTRRARALWASGRTNDLGFILDGMTDHVLESEQPVQFPDAPVQPHYQVIDAGNQVQIYQELIADSDGCADHELPAPRRDRSKTTASGRRDSTRDSSRARRRRTSRSSRCCTAPRRTIRTTPIRSSPAPTRSSTVSRSTASALAARRPRPGHAVLPVDPAVLSAGALRGRARGSGAEGRHPAPLLHDQPSEPGRRDERARRAVLEGWKLRIAGESRSVR